MVRSNGPYAAPISANPSHHPESAPTYTVCFGPFNTNADHSVSNRLNRLLPEKCRVGTAVISTPPTVRLSVQSISEILVASTPNRRNSSPTPSEVTHFALRIDSSPASPRIVASPK